MKIGFIGLGIMGSRMVANLQNAVEDFSAIYEYLGTDGSSEKRLPTKAQGQLHGQSA